MNLFDLSGRVGLVTGSSRGIGYALAKGLLQAGAWVVIHGRDIEQATISATNLADETGGQTRVSTFDVTDRGIADIEDDWGTPDILVNNAGLQRRRSFIEFSLEDWNDLVAFEVAGELDAVVQDSLDQGALDDTDAKPVPAAAARLESLMEAQPWVAVQYVPTLEVETVRQAISDNFKAITILVVGLDGSAIAAWVAVGRADPIILPSPLEIDQDWPFGASRARST